MRMDLAKKTLGVLTAVMLSTSASPGLAQEKPADTSSRAPDVMLRPFRICRVSFLLSVGTFDI